MQDFLRLFTAVTATPHGYCLLWQKGLIALHVISNALIAFAYISIPIIIYSFVRYKKDLQHKHLFALFGLFIFACALTHIMAIVVIWLPFYYLEGIVLAITALASIATAFILLRVIPVLIKMPTAHELEKVNQQLQQEIARRNAAEQLLHISMEKSQQIFDQPLTGLAITSPQRQWLQVNPHLCQMLGYTEQELQQKNWQDLINPKDRDADSEAFKKILHNQSDGYEIDKRFIHKQGHAIWVKAALRCIRKADQSIDYILLAVHDITPLKQIETNLLVLNETLEKRIAEEVKSNREKDHLLIQQSRLAAMGEMMGNIAHQWRQPINALGLLLANIGDAYDYGELDEAYMKQQLAKGDRLIQNMSSTIDDFRNFFKPETIPETFDIKQILNDALSIVEASFRNHNIKLQVSGDECLIVKGLPGQYRQALLNLLGNAKDALSERQIKNAQICITLEQEAGNAVVALSDNAGGIDKKIMAKIFDPYFTTRPQGNGIGLYMTKMIIENSMKGQLTVSNTEQGAEFKIVTPLLKHT